MIGVTYTILISGIILVLTAPSANATPCASEIAQFENVIRHTGNNGAFGPTDPQSIAAQLGHQPTVSSVIQAKRQAQSEFNATLARAKNFAAQGKDTECMQSLSNAKLMFDAR